MFIDVGVEVGAGEIEEVPLGKGEKKKNFNEYEVFRRREVEVNRIEFLGEGLSSKSIPAPRNTITREYCMYTISIVEEGKGGGRRKRGVGHVCTGTEQITARTHAHTHAINVCIYSVCMFSTFTALTQA